MVVEELTILTGENIPICEGITIHPATLAEVAALGEKRYYTTVTAMCSTPSDYKSVLFDALGIDFTTLNDFDLFKLFYPTLDKEVVSLVLCGVDITKFKLVEHSETGVIALADLDSGLIIDDAIYNDITSVLRQIHMFERRCDIPGNETTKRYLIDKDRREMERNRDKRYTPVLAPLISALVNCEQFKYNHFSVWKLPLSVFMDSVQRIQKIKQYNQLMQGAYAGTVDMSKVNLEKVSWLGHLSSNQT